jgi:hydrogenase maturation protein HypF
VKLIGWSIRVRGTVQGVGFRPTVYKLARELGIKGHVLNDGEGVVIEAWAPEPTLSDFLRLLRTKSPPLARIEEIEKTLIERPTTLLNSNEKTAHSADTTTHLSASASARLMLDKSIDLASIPDDFEIIDSQPSTAKTSVAADAAACPACIEDVFSPFSRRFRYPFTNCTHCGPRLSIIKAIPYDRANTCMAPFIMCKDCRDEYEDPEDRRFHAQPNACHVCGPKAVLMRADGRVMCIESLTQLDDTDATATLIKRGEIVAVKGIGGFQLACDATCEEAVSKLRARKQRYDKPFALIARDLDVIRKFCNVNETEAQLLQSHQAPIVILRTRLRDKCENDYGLCQSRVEPGDDRERDCDQDRGIDKHKSSCIAPSVAPHQITLGFMLPYTPLHHLLMKRMEWPVVLTSGNLSDEPQCIDNEECRERLGKIADYLLLHDREIVNREDDSVIMVVSDKPSFVRRGRGYAPTPLPLPEGFEGAPEILAMGGELKNTFCLLKENRAILSQHVGDLEEARTNADYQKNLELYGRLFQHHPERVAVDLHPDYLSTKLGRRMAEERNLVLDEVQHHHAHIASCLADNGWARHGGVVLGVALDGLGYGADGTFWGGEFLLADYTSYTRVGTFKPIAMLGGAQCMREPWRNTYAHLMAEMGWVRYKMDFDELELTRFFEGKALATFNSMLATGAHSPLASSCGRLFDAVAAAVGICRQRASYEGQAAAELEAAVDLETLTEETDDLAYPFAIPLLKSNGLPYIEPLAMWQAVLGDLILATDKGVMSARFHKGLVKAIVHMVEKLTSRDDERWLKTVALSGGVFQNRVLLELLRDKLIGAGFNVLTHHNVPTNDGGLSLGQAAISAALHIESKEQANVSWHSRSNH